MVSVTCEIPTSDKVGAECRIRTCVGARLTWLQIRCNRPDYANSAKMVRRTGVEPARTRRSTRFSTWRVYQFRHPRLKYQCGTEGEIRTRKTLGLNQRCLPYCITPAWGHSRASGDDSKIGAEGGGRTRKTEILNLVCTPIPSLRHW